MQKYDKQRIVALTGSMDPGVLIFLLYILIAHELVCGLIQYRRQAAKPHKRRMCCSSARVCHGAWKVSGQTWRTEKRDLKKSGRIIIRKA